MERYRIGLVSDLPKGEMKRVEIGDKVLCLAHLKCGGFHAIDDRCTHEDESLSEGFLWEDGVECPAHGSRFCLKTGEVTGLPATEPAEAYTIVVQGEELFVEL